jgi:predicted pyridoxine 5'-phosphate oxidase superfamily flavin-nucleotide-binding protein|tara:strand:- start:751 stop:1191 length:441 start_codon:yes stop_codon:yes gene_type:complete
MISIPDNIKNFVNFQKLGYVATISKDGTPNLSPKGTIAVIDKSTLVFADIRSPQTIQNLQENPSIEINVVDPFQRLGYRFKGNGRIINEGSEFDRVLDYYVNLGVKSKISSIVMVDVKSMSEVTSPSYDLGATKDELVSKWKKYYS